MYPQRIEYRIQGKAILAIQEAAESYLIELFEDTNTLAIHARRVTAMQRDMEAARIVRREKSLNGEIAQARARAQAAAPSKRKILMYDLKIKKCMTENNKYDSIRPRCTSVPYNKNPQSMGRGRDILIAAAAAVKTACERQERHGDENRHGNVAPTRNNQ